MGKRRKKLPAGAVEIRSADIDPGPDALNDPHPPYPWHEEWLARARALVAKNDDADADADAIDNCSHCGCKPEDVDRCCTTGAGRNGKPCDGETP